MSYCANCKESLPCDKGCIGQPSKLPGSHHILCDICLDNEEAEICLGGNEELAILLQSYGPNNLSKR